ncbi:mediator of RNA polymerase II transcription subunit 12-like [Phragmites australis]|uniref:mediator of RNA polymerase II transcription subunit 12-like n=1 Tax=Phragmites australis TaxID=29695 RepID=UPI002D78FDF5|nr:mediator of RNA polymerase II transcription subunit 12-like [Phragmites australis]
MQRYAGAGNSAGFSGGTPGGRESARLEASSFSNANYPLTSRRQQQLAPYKLKCDKEPLNNKLGPPDFYPQTTNCPEETLTREYVQSGYKETVEGIEEAREIVLSQIPYFCKPDVVAKCKEALKKRLRAINESRAQKRKAGQVYGVPLSGSLLIKSGVYPEQRPCNEDTRRIWAEALAQPNKRLRSLSEHVPHGYRRKSLFEVLTRYNVPLLRATWFVKVTYLNQPQARPTSNSISTGASDNQRSNQWTKDVVEYLQQILDEFCLKEGNVVPLPFREQSSPGLIAGANQIKMKTEATPAAGDTEEPLMHFKWRYMVRLIQWHLTEELLVPSVLIEWLFNQLQERDSVDVLELLLPIVLCLVDTITLSQTYVRMFVELLVRRLNDARVVDSPKRPSVSSVIAELLRYMVLAVPDTFVSLDCFPLPSFVVPDVHGRGALLKITGGSGSGIVSSKRRDAYRYLSCGYAVCSIQKRVSDLATVANPNLQARSAAKVVQALDKALVTGNLTVAYYSLFNDLSDALMEERWIKEVSPCLQSSLMWIGTVELSLICSIFFLCEWATCDYRDCRTSPFQNVKFTGRRDLSQIHVAVSILKNKMDEMNNLSRTKSSIRIVTNNIIKGSSLNDAGSAAVVVDDPSGSRGNAKTVDEKTGSKDIFESPGPLHDIIVCWLDQHEVSSAAGFTRVDVLIIELIRNGIFYPQAYVRQLIISGITDKNDTMLDVERKRRHHRTLKQLPGPSLFDILEETRTAEEQQLYEMMSTYSSERRLVLSELSNDHRREYTSSSFIRKQSDLPVASGGDKHGRVPEQVEDVKALVSSLLRFTYPHLVESEPFEIKTNIQGSSTSTPSQVDTGEAKNGCEDCMRSKGQKLDDSASRFQGFPLLQSDEEDIWWVRKGTKLHESFNVDPAQKSVKQTSRGRAKVVRKTQSLAQLAAARIEGSQGASTSHVCESKLSCPHHKPSIDGDDVKDVDHTRMTNLTEVGKSLKRLRLLERRSISLWLLKSVKQLVEGNEMTASKATSSINTLSLQPDDKSVSKWRLGDEELLSVLYVLDTCCDLVSGARFLVWLLAKIRGGLGSSGQTGRSAMHMKNREHQVCQVSEALVFSSLLRYENILLATDILPEVLSASMNKNYVLATARHPGSASFAYVRYFLKKYRDVASVARWEKKFRTTCDQRLLAELDNGRSIDGDLISSSGVSAGEEIDEPLRQKLNGRNSRVIQNMKEIVQRQADEVQRNLKEKKILAAPKSPPSFDKEDSHQIAHDIVLGLLECIRQNGGANPDGDPSIVASAVSAVVVNAGHAIAKHLDFTGGNYQGVHSVSNSLNFVRHTLRIHINSLCLLKEALGDRFSRVFEIALALEASSAVTAAFAPPKMHRNQFQPSPEIHDAYGNHTSELSNSGKGSIGRTTKVAAAVSALVLGAVVHGAVSLERMVAALKIKDGLDILQLLRGLKTSTNGVSRSTGTLRMENSIEVFVHWFRILLGNCRTVYDGLIADILGESYILALSRLQQMLPLSVVFPPAYSIFAMVLWRRYIFSREDVQLYQSLLNAINDITRHQPFRDICFHNTHQLYDFLASDVGDSEFAAMHENHSPDKNSKMSFIPLRARLFLDALVDCNTPTIIQGDSSCASEPCDTKDSELKLSERLMQLLDTLQPAKFHWQWVEMRLLLDEQALMEKVTAGKTALESLRSLSPNAESFTLSESEKGFTEVILSRLLARPDAAPLYSEVVHLLGKLQESLVMDVKWILQGQDAILGRRSTRQQLVHIAQRKGLSTKAQVWKPWGWSSLLSDVVANKTTKRKLEVTSVEEGEFVDDTVDAKRPSKTTSHGVDRSFEGIRSINKYLTEKALAELVLPCIDRSSADIRGILSGDLIKQMGAISEHIKAIARSGAKQAGSVPSGNEVSSNKSSGRKGIRGGSPNIGRRAPVGNDPNPPSASALRAALWLRLQLIIRLLPVIMADRSMRHTLASAILGLLATRMIYEDADLPLPPTNATALRREVDSLLEPPLDVLLDRPAESLFERLLCVLHALLGSCKPSWLKSRSASKSTIRTQRDFSAFDNEAAEALQSALDHMELPGTIRRRVQAAMPILPPPRHPSIPCQPPQLSLAALAPLQSCTSSAGPQQKSCSLSWVPTDISSRSKAVLPCQDPEMEVDPWTLLEDGTSCPSTSSGSNSTSGITGDQANLKACSWLKGAVRVRRTELTYIGSLDDDS